MLCKLLFSIVIFFFILYVFLFVSRDHFRTTRGTGSDSFMMIPTPSSPVSSSSNGSNSGFQELVRHLTISIGEMETALKEAGEKIIMMEEDMCVRRVECF